MPGVRALNLYHRRESVALPHTWAESSALERLRQGDGELRISHVCIAGLSQTPPQIMSIPEAMFKYSFGFLTISIYSRGTNSPSS